MLCVRWYSKPKFSVRICPLSVCRDGLDVVPMLNNLSVLKAENVIEGNMLARRRTELPFTDSDRQIADAYSFFTDCLGQGELRYHYVAPQEGRKEVISMSTYALNRQVEVIALVRSFRPIPVEEFDRIARPLLFAILQMFILINKYC